MTLLEAAKRADEQISAIHKVFGDHAVPRPGSSHRASRSPLR